MQERSDDPTAQTPLPEPGDDSASIARAIERGEHREALGRCARIFGSPLGSFAMAVTQSQASADELTRTALLEAYDAFPLYQDKDDLKAWLFGVLRRVCARAMDSAPSQATASPLGSLRPTERDAVLLRYQAGLSLREVAAACGTDEVTARKRVSAALLALSKPAFAAPEGDARAAGPPCREVEDDLARVVDGTAARELFAHIGSCDACRDRRHEAGIAKAKISQAGSAHEPVMDLEEKIAAAVAARRAPSVEAPRAPNGDGGRGDASRDWAARVARSITSLRASLPKVRVSNLALLAALLVILVVYKGKSWIAAKLSPADRPWTGRIESASRASSDDAGGVTRCPPASPCEPARAGDELRAGTRVRTDTRTRAHIELADGTKLIIDRDTEVELVASQNRTLRLSRGALVADVASTEGVPEARVLLPRGYVETMGTKFSLTVSEDHADVEVVRGAVRLVDDEDRAVIVRAGEEGRIFGKNAPISSPALAIADAVDWSEDGEKDEDKGELRGLGELRAKKPGEASERERGVRLASHAVKVRIVDNMARTEVDETFANDAGDTLEGIFRFPLPPDAQIERLALEVGGKWEEGAFVESDKAAAIFRGVLQHAVPNQPKPIEEIIWVPGPWRDPALLEWKQGGRFELKIFPIPAHGSRRIVLAYTQTLPPSGGVRRYTYPLPYDPHGSTTVDDFHVDVKVTGHDKAFGIRSRGYALTTAATQDEPGEKLTFAQTHFVPAGDLSLEYALPNRDAEVTSWAYTPSPAEGGSNGCASDGGSRGAYVAFALRPKLPHWSEQRERDQVIVVDASRSMFGERFTRAASLAASMVREMDRRDRLYVMACDTTCRSMSPGPSAPGTAASDEVTRFFAAVQPEGGSDLVAAVRSAVAMVPASNRGASQDAKGGPARDLRVVYIGDGAPSVGPIKPDHITKEVARVMPQGGSLTAVAIGSDADAASLGALARGGGGVVVPFVPGRRTSTTAVAVLTATYGVALRDPVVELPDGFTDIVPRKLDSLAAGSETLVIARMNAKADGTALGGSIKLKGSVGGELYEQTFPIRVASTGSSANAFVPRLYAATRIVDLEQTQGDGAKPEIVRLSKGCAVASRYTSMLVLESEAMFRAYGLADHRSTSTPLWTGEEGASSTNASGDAALAGLDPTAPLADLTSDEESASPKKVETAQDAWKEKDRRAAGAGPAGFGSGASNASAGGQGAFADGPPTTAAKPEAKSAPMTPDYAPAARGRMEAESMGAPPASPAPAMASPPPQRDVGPLVQQPMELPPPPPRPILVPPPLRRTRMIPMHKVWTRKGAYQAGARNDAVWDTQIVAAQSAAAGNPDSRTKLFALYKLYAASGRTDDAQDLAKRWSARDPLDTDALIARADLAARGGDRERAIRILGGVVDARPDDEGAQARLALLHGWLGHAQLACDHRIAWADERPADAKAVAAAVHCARDQSWGPLADDLLADLSDDKIRSAVDRALAVLGGAPTGALRGDVQIDATWDGDADLDFALIDGAGQRYSWLGGGKGTVSARDVASRRAEAVAFSSLPAGNYRLEVTRVRSAERAVARTSNDADPALVASDDARKTAQGTVTLRVVGQTRAIPFSLTQARVDLGQVRVYYESRLVPLPGWGPVR